MKWNDTPFWEGASPEIKGMAFDQQIEENGGDPNVTHTSPYGDEEGEK